MTRASRFLAFLIPSWVRKRVPREDVEAAQRHLVQTSREDIKLRELKRRSGKLLRDNHLVVDVRDALGFRP